MGQFPNGQCLPMYGTTATPFCGCGGEGGDKNNQYVYFFETSHQILNRCPNIYNVELY